VPYMRMSRVAPTAFAWAHANRTTPYVAFCAAIKASGDVELGVKL
jgi:hypothetical protein